MSKTFRTSSLFPAIDFYQYKGSKAFSFDWRLGQLYGCVVFVPSNEILLEYNFPLVTKVSKFSQLIPDTSKYIRKMFHTPKNYGNTFN